MPLFTINKFYNTIISEKDIRKILHLLISNDQKLNHIMAEQSELVDQINILVAQVAKIGDEVSETLGKVDELEAALEAADDVSPEVQAAFDALKAQVQAVDDLVPDAEA